MRIRSFVTGSAILALTAAGLAGSTASATPGSGTTTNPAAPIPEYQLAGPLRSSSDGIKLKTDDDAVVRSFTLTYASGGQSGWHQHPGIVLAVVQSGTVKRKVPCEHSRTFTTGQAFTEVGPHYVFNADQTPDGEGAPAVLLITQIAPKDTTGMGFREDLPAPVCHPRT